MFYFNKKIVKLVMLLSALLVYASCSTTVSFQVKRAPRMDTQGIQRIAIMPFVTSVNNNVHNSTAQFITSKATANIRSANYFTLVDHREIERLQKNGERIDTYADALFTGEIISLYSGESNRTEQRTDSKTKEKYEIIIYERSAELSFSYRLIRTRDGTIIDIVTRQGKNETFNETRNELKSAEQLLEEIVTKELAKLAQEVAPYTATLSRSLMKEKTKDKELKNEMKAIATEVKGRNYKMALNSYLAIYEQYHNTAAAFNASIMYEALGDIPSAMALIGNVYGETGNPQTLNYLSVLQQSLREQERYIAGYSVQGNQSDRVINYAITEINRVLPQNAKLWIVNNTKDAAASAAIITDGITSGLMKNGITIVDREHSALLEAEENLQMSGVVSDDDFAGIGHAAGANTLVILTISGADNLRRLQLRVLDIATRTSLYQSDASDNWKL